MDRQHRVTRRRFLAACASLGGATLLGGLTGCSGPFQDRRSAAELVERLTGFPMTSAMQQEAQQSGNPLPMSPLNGNALRWRAAAKGLFYGAAADYFNLSKDPDFVASFAEECGMLTPEVSLKWRDTRPTPDTYDFDKSDWLANFAREHNMLYRGHPLVWYNALPKWFQSTVNQQNAEQFLTDHIRTVVTRYAGQMHSWDVVNEAIEPNDKQPGGLRKTPWLELLGPEHIDIAFHTAAAADPNALLAYNDFNLYYTIDAQKARREATLDLLQGMKARGVPIQALGIQAHLSTTRMLSVFDPDVFSAFLREVAGMGLKIMITELDVNDTQFQGGSAERDKAVAQSYYDFLSVTLQEPALIGVMTWGLSDRYSWLQDKYPRSDGSKLRPLPLSADLKRKSAWQVLAKAFDDAPAR